MSAPKGGSPYVQFIGRHSERDEPQILIRFTGSPSEQKEACAAASRLHSNPSLLTSAPALLDIVKRYLADDIRRNMDSGLTTDAMELLSLLESDS